MNNYSANNALVLDIQRMSTEDGPGLRTTVFLKGCSLSCAWCHNPESISPYREIQWLETKCIGCGSCIKECRNDALRFTEKGLKIDRDKCRRCLACARACPAGAMEIKGEEWEVERLAGEVTKDRTFFEKSGGGVTVSGGEALCQYRFVSVFFNRLKELKIHTALDTCGMCGGSSLSEVLPFTDLVLFDIKLMDPVLHEKYTGAPNKVILKNLLMIADRIRETGKPELWIRTPVIPGATAVDSNIASIGGYIAGNLKDVVTRWDLCAFNNLCADKYRRLDRKWDFSGTKLLKKDEMKHFAEIAKSSGADPGIVFWSGPTSAEE